MAGIKVLPTFEEVRGSLGRVIKYQYRMAALFLHIVDGRPAEVVGRNSPRDRSTARGPRARDMKIEEYEGHEIAVFTVNTAKRGGLPRECAVPLDREMEPMTRPVVDYFERFDPMDLVFNFTRQALWTHVKPHVQGFWYPIEDYVENKFFVGQDEEIEEVPVKVRRHWKPGDLKMVRQMRATELRKVYKFDVMELHSFGGWSLRYLTGASPSVSRYLHLIWDEYIDMLLKPRPVLLGPVCARAADVMCSARTPWQDLQVHVWQ